MKKIEIVYLPRRKWPKRIMELFSQQKEEIEEAVKRKAVVDAIKYKPKARG